MKRRTFLSALSGGSSPRRSPPRPSQQAGVIG